MKTYTSLLLSIVLFSACHKNKVDEPATKPVEFKETTYEYLGTFDSSGKPDYLLQRDPISADLLNFVNNTLPEGTDLRKTNPDLLKSKSIADIAISISSD